MIGNVVGIDADLILVNLNKEALKLSNLVGYYVIIENESTKLVGEITSIKNNLALITLMGELDNGKFVFGLIHKPSFTSVVKMINEEDVSSLLSISDYNESKHLYLGKSFLYPNVDVGVELNAFFNKHFAIFGSTGSGKSCSVARIMQNLFANRNTIPYNASIFIFDAYGEYHPAFSHLHDLHPDVHFKTYTTNFNDPILVFNPKEENNNALLNIPIWLLDVDDIAILLGADNVSQMPIIENALKLVNVFVRNEDEVIKHKNDIIARALLDILSSGKTPSQIRDQIFSVLSHFNTKELNLDSTISQPGYSRTLKQCFLIDDTGKIREMELITKFFQNFISEDLKFDLPDGTYRYTLEDLENAFDFAMISAGTLNSVKAYEELSRLKVNLHNLVNNEYSKFFDREEYISRDNYIRSLLSTREGGKVQIVNFKINYVDDRFAKAITKIYSKLLFNYAKNLDNRGMYPFHIILEEAHRYVQNDGDVKVLGYNIFERITKEGRKYGVILGLISQRPSELSETVVSQCSNFLVFKILHPKDVDYIKDMVPNITSDIVKKLKIINPGTCVAFGTAFKIPVIVKFALPDPRPSSDNCDISNTWFNN